MADKSAWYDFFKLNEGETVVDLGAYDGAITSFYAHEVGKTGLVIALEPDEDNYRRLEQRVKENKLSNVRPILMAIGKKTGKTYLNLAKGDNAHSTVLTGRRFRYGKRLVSVISWDDLVKKFGINHVDMAKVNVEGAETEFLEGMSNVYPDKLTLHEHSRFGINLEYLMKLLKERNYELKERRGYHIYLMRGDV